MSEGGHCKWTWQILTHSSKTTVCSEFILGPGSTYDNDGSGERTTTKTDDKAQAQVDLSFF